MLKAIIVDDDLNVAACLRALIPWSELGYQVAAEAANGAEGLAKLMDIRPDVVITDLKMPVMDGAEFCRRIREVSDDTAIIFLSAYESFTTAQLALRCGVTEYILKPINTKKIEQLTDVLASLAKSYHNRDFFHRLISSRELAGRISDRLRCGDAAYFEGFFQEFVDCSASDFTAVQEASLKLVNLLYDYLRELGMAVTIVQRPRHLMTPFDGDMAALIHGEMRRNGVRLALGHTVEGFAETEDGVDVLLQGEAPLHGSTRL